MAYRLLGAAHKVVPISENRRKKIQVIHERGNRLNGGQCQNKIGGAHASRSCWHGNACMIICLKCIAFAGRCTQSEDFEDKNPS